MKSCFPDNNRLLLCLDFKKYLTKNLPPKPDILATKFRITNPSPTKMVPQNRSGSQIPTNSHFTNQD